MIDTVILTVAREDFKTISGAGIPQWELYSRSGNYEKMVRNQNTSQKKDDIYRPRIRGIRRGRSKFMQMEFSVPKLILGNNLEEVCEKDFENVVTTLKERLVDFGVIVSEKVLREATVSSFHPSKNVLLTKGYTSSGILKELGKMALTQKLDLNRDSFRNEGQSLQCYSNSHSLVVYDKIKDLKKPRGRAIDKDQAPKQRSLFDDISKSKELKEVLRIEVRLSKKVKMNQMLEKLGFDKGPTFQDIFKKDVCQKIVEHYWKTIIENENLFIFSSNNSPKELLTKILKKEKIQPRKAIFLVGLSVLCKDERGVRDLRNMLSTYVSSRNWARYSSDLKILNRVEATNKQPWVTQIDEAIKIFGRLRTRDGPDGISIINVTN